MPKINIGSSYVDVPDLDLRSAGPSTSAFDAEVTQRAEGMARQRRNAPGGMNAAANQGVPSGVQGRGGAQPMARPGTIDLAAGGTGQVGGRGYDVGNSTAKKLRKVGAVVGVAGKLVGGADVIRNFNDYKIDDPGVDSSASGTFNALRQGDFAGAGRSLSKGMLETGMDLGSNLANTADLFVPGKAPVSTAYNNMLRNQFGGQLVDNSGSGARPAAPSASQPAASPNAFTPGQTTRGLRDMPGASGEAMKGQFGDFSPAGTFTDGYTDMGRGIAGKSNRADGKMNDFTNIGADGKPTAMSSMDTRSPDQIANGNRLNAETAKVVAAAGGLANLTRNNALMAANLRDGVDLMRGIDGRSQVSTIGNTSGTGGGRRNKFDDGSGMVTPLTGRGMREQQKIAQDAANAERANLATLRGQDMNLQGHLLPKQMEMEMAQRMRALQGQLWQQSGGDPRRAQELALQMGIDGKAFGELADTHQKRSDTGRAQTKDLLAPLSVVQNEKGEDVISPAKQAQREALVRQMLPQFEAGTPDQKALDLRQLAPAINVVDAGNARRSNSFWQQLPRWMPGAEAATPEASTLPDFAPGHLDTVDGPEGLLKGGGVSKGDYRAKVKNGPDVYLDRSKIGVAELELLKSRGVTLRGAN